MAARRGRVPLKAEGPIRILIARDAKDALKARVVYQGPLMAPVEAGLEVGSLRVWGGDRLIQETPLYHRRGGRPRARFTRVRSMRWASCCSAGCPERARALHHARRRGGGRQIQPGDAAWRNG